MDARQAGLHRDAVAFGASYLVILPGAPVPVWRPVSPLRMRAVYGDSLNDEWPAYALEAWTEGTPDGPVKRWRLYDDEAVYTLAPDTSEVLIVEEHGTGFCPVVRYIGEQHLDGELTGEVEPLIPLQDQLDATTFMIEMAQQYAVHRQRWVTGMAVPEDDNGNPIEPFKAAIDRLWVAEDPDTKFGEFAQTDIKAWLDAREATLRHIAIKSQTPPGSLLLGSSVTFPSAEALAATEKPHQRRTGGYKTSLGESHEQAFRLDALLFRVGERGLLIRQLLLQCGKVALSLGQLRGQSIRRTSGRRSGLWFRRGGWHRSSRGRLSGGRLDRVRNHRFDAAQKCRGVKRRSRWLLPRATTSAAVSWSRIHQRPHEKLVKH
jgi:hypothetical protein